MCGSAVAGRVVAGNPELPHLLLEVLPVHADLFGRFGDVAPLPAERLNEKLALERRYGALLRDPERLRAGARRGTVSRILHRLRYGEAHDQIARPELLAARQEERLLHGRAELAHVTLP